MSYNSRRHTYGSRRHEYSSYTSNHDRDYGHEDPGYYPPSSSQNSAYDSPWYEQHQPYGHEESHEDYYGGSVGDQYAYERQGSSRYYTDTDRARYDRHYSSLARRSHTPPHEHRYSNRMQESTTQKDSASVRPHNHYIRDDRPVTPPRPKSPSPSYIKLAQEPPKLLSDATEERKLLILDLNGTLVHRAAAIRPKNKYAPPALDNNGRPLPRLRPVHPRPYMPAFRSYLFAPETKAWLDVMVWSSAQPHSVADMVDRCFGSQKEELLEVWARDTLGLSADHYHRKVQTTKDLNVPWSKLTSLPAAGDADSVKSSRENSPISNEDHAHNSVTHSAFTTLLLDDSPKKAELQPYNHFCVPEYSGERRAKDLELLSAELLRVEAKAKQTIVEESTPAETTDAADGDDIRKRKRKGKKHARRLKAALDAISSSTSVSEAESEAKAFDETLLAVIGVLDEIKLQQNVAAWVHAGGLWGPNYKPNAASVDASAIEAGTEQSTSPPSSLIASASAPVATDGDVRTAEDNADASDLNIETSKTGENDARDRTDVDSEEIPPSSPTGNDAVSSTDAAQTVTLEGATSEDPAPSLWFEHAPTLKFWVEKGKEALERLGIPIEHGIER